MFNNITVWGAFSPAYQIDLSRADDVVRTFLEDRPELGTAEEALVTTQGIAYALSSGGTLLVGPTLVGELVDPEGLVPVSE